MKIKIIRLFSWLSVAWMVKIFLSSLPYKFTGHPDTQHIFGTIGQWIGNVIAKSLGHWFTQYGAFAVGSVELMISIVLVFPAILIVYSKLSGRHPVNNISWFHCFGGLAASGVMAGAMFFHLFTPLGIVVLHQGKSDGGSLFYAAVSIFILGLIMSTANFWLIKNKSTVTW